jgi:hypothetical protein
MSQSAENDSNIVDLERDYDYKDDEELAFVTVSPLRI